MKWAPRSGKYKVIFLSPQSQRPQNTYQEPRGASPELCPAGAPDGRRSRSLPLPLSGATLMKIDQVSPSAGADVGTPWVELAVLSPPAACSAWVPPAGWAADSSSLLCLAHFLHVVSFFPKVDRLCPLFSSTSLRLGQVGSRPWASCFT